MELQLIYFDKILRTYEKKKLISLVNVPPIRSPPHEAASSMSFSAALLLTENVWSCDLVVVARLHNSEITNNSSL